MVVAGLIANLHAAVFYVFFVLMMPYFGEYIIMLLRDSHFIHKITVYNLKKKIDRTVKKEKGQEKLEGLQTKLIEAEQKFEKFKEESRRREENPYRIKLVKRNAVKWLFIVAILCFAMGLLTPLGDEPYTHIFKLLSGNTTQSIAEHQPLVLSGHVGAIIVLTMLFIFIIFTDTKVTLKDGFLLAGLIILTFSARRQFSLLLIIGVIPLTRIICDFINKYDKIGTDEFTNLMVTWKGKILTLIVIVICAYGLYRGTIDDKYIDDTQYPVSASDYILSEVENGSLNLENMRIYNDYNYGSYLLYRGIPVFIDSRADLYSPEFNEGTNIFSDYMNISSISSYYESKFKEYKITHVITYKNSKLNLLISRDENYKSLYNDKYFVFYERLSTNEDNEGE